MNKILQTKNQTPVKLFIKAVMSFSLLYSSNVFAQGGTPVIFGGDGKSREERDQERADAKEKEKVGSCTEAQKRYQEAEVKIGEACRKAGLNVKSCVSEAYSCANASGEESYSNDMATSLGLAALSGPAGIDLNAAMGSGGNKTCPQGSARDYFDEKKRLEEQIQDLEKQLAELKNEEADIKDDVNKTMQDLNKAISDAQDELKQSNLDAKSKERERQAQFMEQQQKNQQQLAQISEQLLSLEIEVTNIQSQKAKDMVELAKSGGKTACLAQYQSERAKLQKAAATTTSSGSAIARGKLNAQALAEFFNTCMSDFYVKRNSINKTASDRTAQTVKKIDTTKKQQDMLNESIAAADSQLAQIKEDAAEEQSNAQQKVMTLITQSQTKMVAAQEKSNTQLQALVTKNSSLTAALNRANNSLLTLGAAPKSRSAEYGPGDASSDIGAQIAAIDSIASEMAGAGCPPKMLKTVEGAQKDYQKRSRAIN